MSRESNLDRESFQQFLASAFAIQESQLDRQFLSAILDIQRLVKSGELAVDAVMNLIVDSAREIAGAAGVAIGLLEDGQLIYRAGSGCAAANIGSKVAASLTVSADAMSSREILRVENARTDKRIEGAICRQFGAESLLILPIYRDRALAGVLEVLFGEAHIFQDREVETYRLMAGLIETAIHKDRLAVERLTLGEALPPSKEYLTADGFMLYSVSRNAIYQRCGAALTWVRQSRVLKQPGLLAKILVQRATTAISNNPPRSLGLAAVATGLGLTLWIAHSNRPVSPPGASTVSRSAAVRRIQPDPMPAEGISKIQVTPTPVSEGRLATPLVRRTRARGSEVDYIGDDVTVRHFTYRPALQRKTVGASGVAYIGQDVTVRYFTPKPADGTDNQ